uniref:Uncharacterized protein n=1 Tax=viral metagenome TaxID=1070528 RepID=A0A6H1Z7D0_9ZZZZ
MGAWFRWIREIYLGRRALGQTTERATETLIANTHDIFTISGGRILVTQILGEFTIACATASSIQLIATPTAGTLRAMCALLLVNGYAIGDLLGITGVNTDPMIPPARSATVEGQTFGVLVQIGAIRLLCNLVGAGSIRWTLKWIPFDTGAAVAAA